MRRRALLVGVLALALGVRLAGVGDRLSADEGYTWLVASAGSLDELLDRLETFENTPPLLYLLLAPLPLDSEAWLRVVPLAASVAQVGVVYAIVRPLAGTAAALLSSLALAVAPYHVSFANYSRAFMLAGLGLLLCTWAAARLAQGRRRRWWWLWVAGGAVALYSEYDSGLYLVALAGVLLVLGTPRRRDTLLFAAAPALLLAPWIPELVDSLRALDETKVAPVYPEPGPAALRDLVVPLAFGEHGAADGASGRWAQLAVVVAALGGLAWSGLRGGRGEGGSGRKANSWFALLAQRPKEGAALGALLLSAVGLATLTLAAIAHVVGPDVFAQRYLTPLIALGAGVVGIGLATAPRWLAGLGAAALLGLGVAVFAERHDRELEPDPRPAIAAALDERARTILTNSAVIAFYARDDGVDVVIDRPFGLRQEDACRPCLEPAASIDDARVAGGPRRADLTTLEVGPYVIVPPER